MTDAARVATARRWFRTLVGTPLISGGAVWIDTPEHADTWEMNFAQPLPGMAGAPLLEALVQGPGRSPRVVITDVLTDPAIEAALALYGYVPKGTVIEMLASGPVASVRPLSTIEIAPVEGRVRRAAFEALVRRDHAEGLRTGAVDPAVSAGLIEAMRRRTPACTFWQISAGDAPVGYGLTAACPGGLGLIENLFVVPEERGRGLMSAFIVQASNQLRAGGCDGIFLDALVDAAPKRLYAALGFAPVALCRTWVQDIGPKSPYPTARP